MKYPTISGFIGHNGANVWLDATEPHEDDDPLVEARPDLFTDTPPPGVEPPKRKVGRPRGSKNQPKPDDAKSGTKAP